MRHNGQNVTVLGNEKRNAYVVEQIILSFIKLLEEKPITDITIIELTDLAEVGRASFYRNFKKKEDIITVYLNQLSIEWVKEFEHENNMSLSEQVHKMIKHFENHRSFYSLLHKRGLTYMLKDTIIGFFGPKDEYEMTQAYASSFVAYTIYGWIDTWFRRGMRDKSDDIYKLFKQQGL